MENTEVKNGSLINNIVESFYKEKSKEITEGVKALFKPEDIAIKVTEKVNDLVVENIVLFVTFAVSIVAPLTVKLQVMLSHLESIAVQLKVTSANVEFVLFTGVTRSIAGGVESISKKVVFDIANTSSGSLHLTDQLCHPSLDIVWFTFFEIPLVMGIELFTIFPSTVNEQLSSFAPINKVSCVVQLK